MRAFSVLSVGLILLIPASARAQAIKVADLVGTWIGGEAGRADTLIIRADSTWHGQLGWVWAGYHCADTLPPEKLCPPEKLTVKHFSRWYRLSGDSLGIQGFKPGYIAKILLQDQQLSLTRLGGKAAGDKYTYKRIDSPTSTP